MSELPPRDDDDDSPRERGNTSARERSNARWIAAGAGAIGSAALVAALMYAGRPRKPKPPLPTTAPETD